MVETDCRHLTHGFYASNFEPFQILLAMRSTSGPASVSSRLTWSPAPTVPRAGLGWSGAVP